jgi:alcohol dehydrogenase class IV
MEMQMYALQLPKRIVFGIGIVEKLGAEAKALGATKALIVTDETIQKLGFCTRVEKSLREAVDVDVFDNVESEPSLEDAEIVASTSRGNYDLIVGIGGGSVLDMAKVSAAAAANQEQRVRDFLGANMITNPSVPKILIPTTAGTGAEATPYALVSVEGRKKTIASPYNLADVVFIDASFTTTMPPRITASTGMDALSHAIEAFLSRGANSITDTFALEAMKKIADNLEEAFSHGDNLDARLNMSLAALLAGMAFGNAGVIVGHAIAHTVEAKYKIPHGVSVALTLPYIMEYNAPAVQEKLAKVARVLGETGLGLGEEAAASRAAKRVKSILETLELPTKLSELHVPKEDLPMMAEELLKAKGYLARNPRNIEYEDAVAIFEKMW